MLPLMIKTSILSHIHLHISVRSFPNQEGLDEVRALSRPAFSSVDKAAYKTASARLRARKQVRGTARPTTLKIYGR